MQPPGAIYQTDNQSQHHQSQGALQAISAPLPPSLVAPHSCRRFFYLAHSCPCIAGTCGAALAPTSRVAIACLRCHESCRHPLALQEERDADNTRGIKILQALCWIVGSVAHRMLDGCCRTHCDTGGTHTRTRTRAHTHTQHTHTQHIHEACFFSKLIPLERSMRQSDRNARKHFCIVTAGSAWMHAASCEDDLYPLFIFATEMGKVTASSRAARMADTTKGRSAVSRSGSGCRHSTQQLASSG